MLGNLPFWVVKMVSDSIDLLQIIHRKNSSKSTNFDE